MKRDIRDRSDIDRLMSVFYARATTDDVIGYIFTEVAKLDIERHLPVIGDFWETMLFRTGDYGRHGRNPLDVHGELSLKEQLLPEHFERWLEIFGSSVDDLFEGETASFLKMRANAIAQRMMQFVSMGAASELGFPHAA